MSPIKPSDFPLLTEVFRDGLEYGLISKDEVVAWADSIITKEDESDYFFIEISISHDKNTLIALLNEHIHVSNNPVPSRVILGLLYQELINKNIDPKIISNILSKIYYDDLLSDIDYITLYKLDYFDDLLFGESPDDFIDDKIEALSIYKEFNLNNWEGWPEINSRVENALKAEQARADVAYELHQAAERKKVVSRRRWFFSIVNTLALAALFMVIAGKSSEINNIVLSKFQHDLYQISLFYLCLFVPCFIGWLIDRLLGRIWSG